MICDSARLHRTFNSTNAHHLIVTTNTQCLEPLRLALFGDGEEQRAAMEAARTGLALVEEQLKDKRFFGGDDAIGLADIAGGGLLAHWLGVLEEVAGVSVLASGSEEELPAVRRWAAEYRSSEAVQCRRACRTGPGSSPTSPPSGRNASRWPNRRCRNKHRD